MIKKVLLMLSVTAALHAGAAQAANEYFVKILGIAGTSQIRGLEDYIEVQSWSLGFDNGACQGLNFIKQMDSSSADLTGAALSGSTYPRIVLLARKSGEQPFVYMRLTLNNVVFTSFRTAGSSGDSLLPVEQITARPSSVKTELYEQDVTGRSVLVATSKATCP